TDVRIIGHERAPALPRDDEPFALQLHIGALDGDDAHFHTGRQRPDAGQLMASRPVADGDLLTDLIHDLLVHGATVALGYDEFTVHVYILCIYSIQISVKRLSNRRSGRQKPPACFLY